MNPVPAESEAWVAESPLTVGDLARALGRRWWWPVGLAILGGILAALWVFNVAPSYRAAVVVVPANVDKRANVERSVVTQLEDLASGDSVTEEALAVLQSREFGERFIADHKLLPQFFPKAWDPRSERWTVPEDRVPTLAQGFKHFDRDVRGIGRDKRTGLITLYIDWTDREAAASWANELIARVNADMRQRSIDASTASLAFLEKERERTAYVETRLAIDRLVEAQIRRRMLASVTPEYVFRVVDRALPPDRNDPVGPSRAFVLVAGPLLGLVLGIGLAWLHAGLAGDFRRRRPGERDA
jgi:uncharacterized protein involved in exopolysaccharide biosynthesis